MTSAYLNENIRTIKQLDGRGSIVQEYVDAHDHPINKIMCFGDGVHLFVTGEKVFFYWPFTVTKL
jgi:hypothetical protein